MIGVYEPLVHVFGGLAWRTSRAAEPGVTAAGGELYHAACYDAPDRNVTPRLPEAPIDT